MKALEMTKIALHTIKAVCKGTLTDFALHGEAHVATTAEDKGDSVEQLFSIKSADGTKIRTYAIKIELIYVE